MLERSDSTTKRSLIARAIGLDNQTLFDLEIRLGDHLSFEACFPDQLDKRRGAAIHGWNLLAVEFYQDIIQPRSRKRCHQVFDGPHLYTILADGGRMMDIDDVCGLGLD